MDLLLTSCKSSWRDRYQAIEKLQAQMVAPKSAEYQFKVNTTLEKSEN